MRSAVLLAAAVLTGCGALDSNFRPSVMPKMLQLPRDAHHRDVILDHTADRARPEQRRSLTAKERKLETSAAMMAALLGVAFSKSTNVMFGVATDVEENHLFEKPAQKRRAGKAPADAKEAGDNTSANELVPWVKLDP